MDAKSEAVTANTALCVEPSVPETTSDEMRGGFEPVGRVRNPEAKGRRIKAGSRRRLRLRCRHRHRRRRRTLELQPRPEERRPWNSSVSQTLCLNTISSVDILDDQREMHVQSM